MDRCMICERFTVTHEIGDMNVCHTCLTKAMIGAIDDARRDLALVILSDLYLSGESLLFPDHTAKREVAAWN